MEESRGFKSIAKHVQERLIISSGGDVESATKKLDELMIRDERHVHATTLSVVVLSIPERWSTVYKIKC